MDGIKSKNRRRRNATNRKKKKGIKKKKKKRSDNSPTTLSSSLFSMSWQTTPTAAATLHRHYVSAYINVYGGDP